MPATRMTSVKMIRNMAAAPQAFIPSLVWYSAPPCKTEITPPMPLPIKRAVKICCNKVVGLKPNA